MQRNSITKNVNAMFNKKINVVAIRLNLFFVGSISFCNLDFEMM